VNELEVLVSVAEGFCHRKDLPEKVYRDLLQHQEILYKKLHENETCYGSKEMREQAITYNRHIVLCLSKRLEEFA
jgi:hypothetical protein